MPRIRLLKITYLVAYIHALRTQGVEPEALLQKHGIPVDFEFIPDFVLAADMLHRFIEDAAACASPGVISSAAGFHNAAWQSNPFQHNVYRSITLLDAIRRHNENVAHYSSDNKFVLELKRPNAQWRKLGLSPSAETELCCVASLVGHIRTFLGKDWLPGKMEVSVVSPGVLETLPDYDGVEVNSINLTTALTFPVRDLSVPRRWHGSVRANHSGEVPQSISELDFLQSLHLVMMSYARIGDLNIDTTAQASNLSRRTLQRQLSSLGLTYSTLQDQVRYESACSLLLNATDMGVTQIGYELGYRDPGSFSRAFRRLAGIAPSVYRRLNAGSNSRKAAGSGGVTRSSLCDSQETAGISNNRPAVSHRRCSSVRA